MKMTNKLNLALVDVSESLASLMVIPNIEAKEIADASKMFNVDKPLEILWIYQVTNEAMIDNIMMHSQTVQ